MKTPSTLYVQTKKPLSITDIGRNDYGDNIDFYWVYFGIFY